MAQQHLVYRLKDRYIHDWLALGPAITPVAAQPPADEGADARRGHLLQADETAACDFARPPQELEKVEQFGEPLYWDVVHCRPDHLIAVDVCAASCSHVRAWAFTRLASPAAQPVTLHCAVCCPASLWLNGKWLGHCAHLAAPDDQTLRAYSFAGELKRGPNDLLVRLEQIAAGDVVLALAVRVDTPAAAGLKVNVPTITKTPTQRQEWERALEHAHLDRAVYQRAQTITVVCDDAMPGVRHGSIRLQQPDGLTYGRMDVTFKAGARLEGLIGAQMAAGPMQAVLTPAVEDYYTQGFRARRVLPFTVNTGFTTEEPAGDYDDRLVAVIQDATRNSDPLTAGLARMALGWWQTLDLRSIRSALARVKERAWGCLDDLLGLAAMRLRMGQHPQFPADLREELDACLLAFDYVNPESGRSEEIAAPDGLTESDQITLYAAQIVAGQLYGSVTLPASNATGASVRALGEQLAGAWLRRHAQVGFTLWNSRHEPTISALALLADVVENEDLRDLAAAVLDKLIFGLAVNSFRGAYAAPRAEARAGWLRSGSLAPEAPLNYLLWGVGGLNTHLRGAVSLGLAGRNYRAPELFRAIALDRWPAMLSRERQQIGPDEYVNTVVFKTPDAMLASAQDYRAGQRGRRQHVWQATFGCDAIVFANHPTSFSDADARQAGWWCGNGSLPRVAQRNDALIALYNLPADDLLGFTHAFFPAYAFDEYILEGGWAFARKGEGYLALQATQGLTLATNGDDAFRELRSAGLQNAWLCQIGRAAVDGSFADFRRAVQASGVAADGLDIAWRTIRGERLTFGWRGPLRVDGRPEPISGFKHVENPYALAEFPAEQMEIGYGEDMLRLHFA